MTTTADRPATLDHEDAQNIARRLILDALHEHTGTEEHGRVWTLLYREGPRVTEEPQLDVLPVRDGFKVTAEEQGTGQRVEVVVFVGGVVLP